MAKLVLIQGDGDQRELVLGDVAVLGRSPDCDLVIPGPLSSRQHAKITLRDGVYHLEDLQSANGTAVNGYAVSAVELQDGDWIGVGDCQLTFVLDDEFRPPQLASLLDEGMPTVVDTFELAAQLERIEVVDSAAVGKLRTHLGVVGHIAESVCGALEIRSLVALVLDELLNVFPQADNAHAVLSRLGENGGDLCVSAARGGGGARAAAMSQTLLEAATRDRKAILASDASSDARFDAARSIVGQGLRSIICSPLVVGPETLGAIQVDTTNEDRPFGAADAELLMTVAGQVAVAAENARLHTEMVAQQRLAAVGEAVSGIAHCIKNVINGLKGGSYILDLGLKNDDSEKVGKGWEMVKRNTGFMSDLVQDMLAYCRRAQGERVETDVAGLLNEVVLMVQEAAARQGVRTEVRGADGLPRAIVDPTGLKRVVLNLVTNAVEACSEGCLVAVTARAEDDGRVLRILVEDDGPGIPEDVQARLFEAFFTTKGSRGTGLGLALVRKVIEEHSGTVTVRSKVGEGTVFDIALPTRPCEPQTGPEPQERGEDESTQYQKEA